MPEKQRCLIYTRPHPLAQTDSLEWQKESLRQYAEKRGYTVVGEATDLAGVQELSKSHSFDVLAVRSLTQIGRDAKSALSVMESLTASGQIVDSEREGIISPVYYKIVSAVAASFQAMVSGAEAPEGTEPEAEQTITMT